MSFRRLLGFLLIIGAASGFIFSVIGLVEIWRYRPVVTQTVVDTLALFDETLSTTQDGLTVVGQVVETTSVDVTSLQTTTLALARSIHDTSPMLDSLTTLTSKDFPAAIDATKASLDSAQSSALLIDNVLSALTSIPFLPVDAYKPDVPLHTALAQVSTSLNSLTPALSTITSSLVDGKTNLALLEVEINKISATTKEIGSSLSSARNVVERYKAVTTQLRTRVGATQLAVKGWMTTLTLILTFLLGWLILVQLGMWVQGLDIIRGRLLIGNLNPGRDASSPIESSKSESGKTKGE